jgi:hypothetical protein
MPAITLPIGMLGQSAPPPQQTQMTPELLAAKSRPRGMLGNIGSALFGPQSSRMWLALGASAHDIAHGTNTAQDLYAMLQDQQRQALQDAWQRQVQDRQRMQWGAEDRFAQSLPPNMQDLGIMDPTGTAGAMIQSQTRSRPRPMTADERRQWNLQPNTSASIDQYGTPNVVQQPYHPPINQWTVLGGQDSGGFTPNPAGHAASTAPQVGEVQDGYRFNGGDPANPNSWSPVR